MTKRTVLNAGHVELVRYSGSDTEIVNAARVSYNKHVTHIGESDIKLLKFLAEHGHLSPFEHTQFTFNIKCPLFVARQWVRHRLASYNECSMRYTEAKPEFFIPPSDMCGESGYQYNSRDFIQSLYQMANENAYLSYKQILKMYVDKGFSDKRARELARSVLPTGTYTEFIFTVNMRALQHFIDLRSDSHAQLEIQEYANTMNEIILDLPEFKHTTRIFDALRAKE